MPYISGRVSMLVVHDTMSHFCVLIFQKTHDQLEKFANYHKFTTQNLKSDLDIWQGSEYASISGLILLKNNESAADHISRK